MAFPLWYMALFAIVPVIFGIIGLRRYILKKRERRLQKQAKDAAKRNNKHD